MNCASYDPVAAWYDRHWGNEFTSAAQAAFDSLLCPLIPRAGAVVDLCCGTGLILAHLYQLGFRVYGVDESSKMLVIARRNAPRATLLQADMAEFRIASALDAAVSFYNSLNHARSLEHLRSALLNLSKHLKTGGCFLFDYVTPEGFETAWEWNEQIEVDGCTVEYIYRKSSRQAICLINGHHEIRQIAIQPDELHGALGTAGMGILQETPMAGASPAAGRHLVLAQKQ